MATDEENFAEDMRDVAMALASPDLDDDETERNVSEAMWLIKKDDARAALSDGLGILAVDACTSDDGYERTLNLLLNALVLEVEAIADAAADGDSDDADAAAASPTDSSTGLARAVCRLVVRSTLGASDDPSAPAPPTEMDMRREAMDILTETLGGEHDLGQVVVESLLLCARSPPSDANRGEYGPALVLARHTRSVAPPPEDEDARKWNSDAEDKSSAFRRDLMDLLGRRVFVLGGNAPPATPPEVGLCAPLIADLTKDEFDGSMLRPLKFKLMSAPSTVMDTVAAFVEILVEAGRGEYVVPHLGGGTNLVGNAVKVLKAGDAGGGKGMAGAARACAALVRASPIKGAESTTEALAQALKDSAKGDDDDSESAARLVGPCLGLEAVGRALLALRDDEGKGERSWVQLANEVALPALEGAGDGCPEVRNAAGPWYDLAGQDAPPPAAATAPPAAAAAARRPRGPRSTSRDSAASAVRPGAHAAANTLDDRIAAKTRAGGGGRGRDRPAGAAAAATAAAAPNNSRDASDAAAKARARGGGGPPQQRRPGAQSAHDLDARIQQKAGQGAPPQRGGPRGSARPPSSGGAASAPAPGAQSQTREQLDQLDARIRNKSRQGAGGPGPGAGAGASMGGPEDDDWDRIKGKTGSSGGAGGARSGNAADDDAGREKIVVASGAGTSYGVGPGPGGSIPIKGGDDFDDNKDGTEGPDRDGGATRGGGGGYGDAGVGPLGGGGGYHDDMGGNGAYGDAADLAYGTDGMGMVDGAAGADGLAVAVAVSPDEDEAFIPAAIEYDPDSKPPLYKNRRFRIYSIAAVALLVLVVVAVVVAVVFNTKEKDTVTQLVASTPDPTPMPTPMPTTLRWTMGVREQIEELVGADKVASGAPVSPYTQALNWMLNIDPLQLKKDSPFIVQRYLLALLYYSADVEGIWRHCAPADPGDDQECKAVVYDQDGEPYNDTFYRMLSGQPECEWYGVRCPGGDGFVREIEMIENNMTGTLPSELAEMPVLQRLSFIMNDLEGTLHPEFGNMKHLIDIEFHYNQFSGTIPDSFYNADNLIRLNLGGNLLSGSISPAIKNLRSMVGLFTFDNSITGPIPKEVGELDYLSYTRWSYNLHSGPIPTEVGLLTNLIELYLQWNELTGSLPPTVGDLTYLEDFFVNNNQLDGTLPVQFYSMEGLTYFYCFDNSFSGTISPLVRRLTNLERFIIRRNFFTGVIPDELAELKNITMVWAHYNDFTGVVSENFCELYDPPYAFQSFYTDCGSTDGTGPPAVECVCCTDCCDSVQETCLENE